MKEAKEIHPRHAATIRMTLAGALLVGFGMSACFLTRTPSADTKLKRQEWRESRGPVVPHDTFPSDCTVCHAKGSWHEIRKDFVFDHEKQTGVPLKGAHEHAQCLRCHNDRGSVAVFANRGCAGCHEDIHRSRLGIQCLSCHTEDNWNPTGLYAAHARTRFPLTDVHLGVACFRCHPAAESGEFQGADPRCAICHQNDALSAKQPDHVALGLLTDCQRCHFGGSWTSAHFNHAGIVNGCVKCHQTDYNNTTNPNHAATGIATNCESCHNTNNWNFNHAGITSGCSSCHMPDYNSASPNHVSSGFGTNCELCHVTTNWATFSHKWFSLTGPHSGIQCTVCHTAAPNFATYTCVKCHPNGIPNKAIRKKGTK